MKPRLLTCFWLFFVYLVPGARFWPDGEPLNNTEHHVSRTAVADGELGSARSGVYFDRRPAYINAEDSHLRPNDDSPPGGSIDGSKDVLETQHTTCQVTTEQLVSTAQATVTRVLKGLCMSKEMDSRLSDLQSLLLSRFDELKGVVSSLEARMDDYNEALRRGRYQQMETLVNNCVAAPKVNPTSSESKRVSPEYQSEEKTQLGVIENETEDMGPREAEIIKYNSSIYIEPHAHGLHKKIFTYYWRIPNMKHKLTEMSPKRSVRSSSFYIYPGGYRLYLRSYPRQGESNFFVHVGLTKGEFDETLKWPFTLKLRVNILDQTPNTRMFEDIASRTWDPTYLCSEFNWQKPTKGDNHECVGLGLPHDLLYHRKYIHAGNLVVKLIVYLEQ